MQALEDIYFSNGGETWHWKSSNQLYFYGHYAHWNFSGIHNPCAEHWQGLLCSCGTDTYILSSLIEAFSPPSIYALYQNSSNCSIAAIDLSEFNMTGILPLSIGNLTQLLYIKLSTNYLFGPIPYSIGSITNLLVLDLMNNNFTGIIPTTMYTLPYLRDLTFAR